MKSKIQKWGNSLAVRIPRTLAQQCRIQQGTSINIIVIHNQVIIKPEGEKLNSPDILADTNEGQCEVQVKKMYANPQHTLTVGELAQLLTQGPTLDCDDAQDFAKTVKKIRLEMKSTGTVWD